MGAAQTTTDVLSAPLGGPNSDGGAMLPTRTSGVQLTWTRHQLLLLLTP